MCLIKNPEIKDKIILRKMWKDIFKDDDKYLDIYFSYKFDVENIFVIYEENEIVSALYAENVNLFYKNEIKSAVYFCGISTREDKRNKGYAGKLIKYAISHYSYKDFIFLIPANQSLFSYYKKFGFKEFTYMEKKIIKYKEDINLFSYSSCYDVRNIEKLYENLNNDIYVIRSEKMLEAIGKCYEIMMIDDGYIAYYKDSDRIYIMEYSFSFEKIKKIAGWLNNKYNLKETIIYKRNSGLPFSLCITKLDIKNIENKYINLMLN